MVAPFDALTNPPPLSRSRRRRRLLISSTRAPQASNSGCERLQILQQNALDWSGHQRRAAARNQAKEQILRAE